MRHGRIDTRFPRLRFRGPDRFRRNIPRHRGHRTGTVSTRTSWPVDSPFLISPFAPTVSTATLDVVPLPHRPAGLSGESPDRSAFGDYVILGDCMQVSKPAVLLTHSFRVVWSAVQRNDPARVSAG